MIPSSAAAAPSAAKNGLFIVPWLSKFLPAMCATGLSQGRAWSERYLRRSGSEGSCGSGLLSARLFIATAVFLRTKGEIAMAKSKSMTGKDGERKLAADHGRAKHKGGGEPQKQDTHAGTGGKTGSSKQRKG